MQRLFKSSPSTSMRPLSVQRPAGLGATRGLRVMASADNGSKPTAVAEKPSTPPPAPTPAPSPPPKSPFDYKSITPEFDEIKEEQREYMQNVYGNDEWRRHRSSWRYLRHLANMTNSRIVYYLFVPSAFFAGLAGAVGTYATMYEQHALPEYFPQIPNTSQVLTLMVTALSLLLVFRTNSSYGRWDEARKMWGLVVNRSRDLARQAASWFPNDDDVKMFHRWLATFPFAMKCHLLGVPPVPEVDYAKLLPEEREMLLASKHRPVMVMQVLSNLVQRAGLTDLQLSQMDLNLTVYEDCVGGCERILRSPIPLGYTRHTSRMLILWLLQLPFGLWYTLGWDAVPATFIIAYFTLGIEEIGVLIEEPFSILPLNAISNTIKTNIEEVGETRVSAKELLGGFRQPVAPVLPAPRKGGNSNDPASWLL